MGLTGTKRKLRLAYGFGIAAGIWALFVGPTAAYMAAGAASALLVYLVPLAALIGLCAWFWVEYRYAVEMGKH